MSYKSIIVIALICAVVAILSGCKSQASNIKYCMDRDTQSQAVLCLHKLPR
jgi:hypothetical protein